MHPVIILHHHEIILKGENRRYFERQLMKNVRISLRGVVAPGAIRGGYGRSIIDLAPGSTPGEAEQRLTGVFGLSNICTGLRIEQEADSICTAAGEILEGREFKTIRVETRRVDKNFPVSSMALNARVGEYLCTRFSVRANLSRPDETIYIELVDGAAYVYRSKLKGPGGLPVGVSGRVAALLSAGFDSPVAAWQMMKRGASVIFVHFHSMPYTSVRSVEQVRQIVAALTRYQFQSKLFLVPFAESQNEIVLRTPQPLRVILYRRMMIRIAEAVARRERAEALATGESIGQVASQTLRNIRVINDAASLPVLRPLSGSDKEDIMSLARTIGTHDLSKEQNDDCCSYLAPRNPATWADPSEVREAETTLDIPGLVEKALGATTSERFSSPAAADDEEVERHAVEEPAGDPTIN
jgi:thiamine biosynthesis protein ThiI